MSTDLEELLTEEMHRTAGAAHWRPGLLDGALALRRRRRVRQRLTVAASATAVAVAVAIVVAGSGQGARTSGGLRAQTAAYVLRRASSAVAGASGDVLEVTARPAGGVSMTAWMDQATGQMRAELQAAGGRPTYYYAGPSETVVVNYATATYQIRSVSSMLSQLPAAVRQRVEAMPRPVEMVPAVFAVMAATWGGDPASLPTPQSIQQALASGSLSLVGTQTVNGQRLLHLRGSGRSPGPQASPSLASGPAAQTLDLWVSAVSYLPVRSVVSAGPGTAPMEASFTWLSGTPANLAAFTPQIPAGFTEQTTHCPCG
jgi:hypothetical protein